MTLPRTPTPQVSVVEDLYKRREPMAMAGVYFITPTPDSVKAVREDYKKAPGTYPSAHIFFSSPVSGAQSVVAVSC